MASSRSRVGQAVIGAILVGAVGTWFGVHSVAATTPTGVTNGAQSGRQAAASGAAGSSPSTASSSTQSSSGSSGPTVNPTATFAPPPPTATPTCGYVAGSYNADGTVTQVPSPSGSGTFLFRESGTGCVRTIVVNSITAVNLHGAPQIAAGLQGTVQGTMYVNPNQVIAGQIDFTPDN